jgi:TPR repeat protein
MPVKLICCLSLPPTTILSVPIYDFAIANEELADKHTEHYYTCCGKGVCGGCIHSCRESGNDEKCLFCNADCGGKSEEEEVAEIMKRVAANDANSINMLAGFYYLGRQGLQRDQTRAIELYVRAENLGCSAAHNNLAGIYHEGGNMKKAKFHLEAGAMAGHEVARYNLANMEGNAGNVERAVKHWTIAASAGDYHAMHTLRKNFEGGFVSRESIDSTLTAYNSSCADMRSEARDVFIRGRTERI